MLESSNGEVDKQCWRVAKPRLWILTTILLLAFTAFTFKAPKLDKGDYSGPAKELKELKKEYRALQRSYRSLQIQVTDLQNAAAAPQNKVESSWQALEQQDTFTNFNQAPNCSTKTSDLHVPHEPKCNSREDVLRAMSWGGRHGFDAPYKSRGCDMQWFTTEEICQILSRFDRIHMVGDSLMRQLLLAMHILMREDLVNGARATWVEGNPEDQDCHCRTIFSKGSNCFWYEAMDSDEIWKHDAASMRCKNDEGRLSLHLLPAYPLHEEQVPGFVRYVLAKQTEDADGEDRPDRNAYIFGNGVWHDFDADKTIQWINQMEDGIRPRLASFFERPRLFITPSAQNEQKHPMYIDKGNNILVQHHVHAIEMYAKGKGYDHLGPPSRGSVNPSRCAKFIKK